MMFTPAQVLVSCIIHMTTSLWQLCWLPHAQEHTVLAAKLCMMHSYRSAALQTGWLEIVSLVVIVTNTAVMASASYPGNPQWQAASDILNVAFCCYFALELLVKLLGVGLKAFVRDRMNQFDALVVAASLVEVVMFLLPGDETSEWEVVWWCDGVWWGKHLLQTWLCCHSYQPPLLLL